MSHMNATIAHEVWRKLRVVYVGMYDYTNIERDAFLKAMTSDDDPDCVELVSKISGLKYWPARNIVTCDESQLSLNDDRKHRISLCNDRLAALKEHVRTCASCRQGVTI